MTHIFESCEQGSPEWHRVRSGACTASRFAIARQRMKRAAGGRAVGDPTAECEKYAWLLALERISGQALADPFETWAMKRGRELEQSARELYEARTGHTVEAEGFVLTEDRAFGYSTDGKVYGQRGRIEIKAPVAPEKVGGVWSDPLAFVAEHIDQCDGGLWITGDDWIDLVVYTPWLTCIGKDLFVYRIMRDEARIAALEEDLTEFWRLTRGYEDKLRATTGSKSARVQTSRPPAPGPAVSIPFTAPQALPDNIF